jgi:hypothetical protein
MPDQTPTAIIPRSLLTLFNEVMSHVTGYFLDDGATMLETLTLMSSEEASQPVSSRNASLAAQVNHVLFYLDATIQQTENADWDGSWKVGAVTDTEWQNLIAQLEVSTERARTYISMVDGSNEGHLSDAIALIAHSAYHLGEIRQGISVIRDKRA